MSKIDFRSKMHRDSVHKDIVEPAINTNIDIKNNINNDINIIQPRPRYTDTHKATMIYIEAELANKLDAICRGKKGLKSQIVNEALKQYLKKLEKPS